MISRRKVLAIIREEQREAGKYSDPAWNALECVALLVECMDDVTVTICGVPVDVTHTSPDEAES